MTVNEAIAAFREVHPSEFDDEILIRWISELEYTAVDEIFLTHGDIPRRAVLFDGYSFRDDRDTELLIGEPFCGVYTDYLAMKSDIAHSDIQRYNNSASLFISSYGSFADWYNRHHLPRSRVSAFTF